MNIRRLFRERSNGLRLIPTELILGSEIQISGSLGQKMGYT